MYTTSRGPAPIGSTGTGEMSPADRKYFIRRYVYIRDDFTCQDCEKRFPPADPENYTGRTGIDGLTLGHIIPRSLRGHFAPDNLRAQCEECNTKLGNQIWVKELRRALTHYTLK